MSLKEYVTQELDTLGERELEQVADYVSFLKFQSRAKSRPSWNEAEVASLYAEFEQEDRELAEAGMEDYAPALEDARCLSDDKLEN
ncbi:MAG: hypothetical protein M3347_14980 [Armatimonadota bacterium]|nr:hypothetical protein [Armatimonadota bacterium]